MSGKWSPMACLRASAFGTLLVAAFVAAAIAAPTQQYDDPGSFAPEAFASNVPVDANGRVVDVVVTYPNAQGAFPLVLAFNGFQCHSSWYRSTVRHLASWGYVIFQYNLDGWSALRTTEGEEVKYLQPLVHFLKSQNANASSPLAGKIDFSRMAVLGHSRGGKLASLHYANRTDIKTAVLFDPVDCGVTGQNRPSAVAALGGVPNVDCGKRLPALTRSKKTAAVIGAGFVNRIKPCNPPNTNYESILSVLAPGSWKVLIKKAGHMQFANTDDWRYKGIDLVCGKGRITTEDVLKGSNTIAVAWLDSVFRSDDPETGRRLTLFGNWLEAQQHDAVLSFEALPGEEQEQELEEAGQSEAAPRGLEVASELVGSLVGGSRVEL